MNFSYMTRKSVFTLGLPLLLAFAVACGIAIPSPETNVAPNAPAPADIENEPVLAPTSLEPISANPTPGESAIVETTEAPPEVRQMAVAQAELDADQIAAAFESVLNNVYENMINSVVHIRVSQELTGQGGFGAPFGGQNGGEPDLVPRGEGSGMVWDDQGRVVTNNHVVADADGVTVIFADGTELDAEVLGTDPDSDLAVLQISPPSDLNLVPVVKGDSDAVKVGQIAIAIGNPFGQEFTVTSGIVSAVGRTISSGNSQFSIPEVVQTDAPINPGNSGGPLLNRKGEVIGINTQIISRSGSSSGIGFAVPIDVAKQVVPVLIEKGAFEYAWLGISGGSLTRDLAEEKGLDPATRGVAVIEAPRDGPAATAGIEGSGRSTGTGELMPDGDVITAVNGTPIKQMNDLIAYLVVNTRPGDTVTFEVIRADGAVTMIDVTLGSRP